MRIKKQKVSIEFEIEYDEVEWKGSWIPKTVYKYRNWSDLNHRKMFQDIALWVPDSFDFNDPFDCNIPIAYELLLTDEVLGEAFVRKLVGHKGEEEVQKRLKEAKHRDPNFIAKYKEDVHNSNRKVHGVFSVTPINNNILMWSHYANSHKGFCVGFDSVKLFEHLGGGGPVSYLKEFPIISPVEDRDKQYGCQVMTKSIHWGYEVEYRLTTFQKTNQNIDIPKEAITEVVFGAKMLPEHKKEIKILLTEKLPHVKCFSVVPEKSKFELTIVPE